MPTLDEIVYSRDETVAAVTGYYRFLTAMYMADEKIIYPPAQGWPSVLSLSSADDAHADARQSLGKSAEVLALLARLPYVHRVYNWSRDPEAAAGCVFADWQQDITELCRPDSPTTGRALRVLSEGAAFAELAPAHVVGLASGDRESPVMVLDTRLGIVHWEDCPRRIEEQFGADCAEYEPDEEDDDGEDVPEAEADWRYSATAWPVADFFRVLEAQFRELQWIPISAYTVRSVESCGGAREAGMVPMLQAIYRQHGWPDLAVYRKAACLAAVRKALEEHYPDSVCSRE